MKKVSFFIVGNQKSGTTTFHNLLKLHPEIFLPSYKELKFFCTDLHRESDQHCGKGKHFGIRTIGEYRGAYKDAKEDQILGEITPHYTFSKEAAKGIFEYNPEAKVIIFLREPASFIESLHSELLDRLAEDEEDLFKAMELEKIEDRVYLYQRVYIVRAILIILSG